MVMVAIAGYFYYGLAGLINEISKFFEKVRSIVRSGCRLGVILNRKNGVIAMPHALDGPVIQVEMGDLDMSRESSLRQPQSRDSAK
jgi:hypothetical protein